MTRTESDSELVARLERALAARGERAWSLVILAGASALAARLEPPLGAFWDWAALIAACASALAGAAALGARGERDAALDGILIVSSAAAPGEAAAERARRIGAPRARARLAARLDALVVRSDRGRRVECFQAGLVRMHAGGLRAVAARLRGEDARRRRWPGSTGSWATQGARSWRGMPTPSGSPLAAANRDRPGHTRTGIITPCLRPTPSSI